MLKIVHLDRMRAFFQVCSSVLPRDFLTILHFDKGFFVNKQLFCDVKYDGMGGRRTFDCFCPPSRHKEDDLTVSSLVGC